MPTQSPTGLQEVSPLTVIPELVLGFLSLTIEVDSFDPEKGWWFSFTAGTSPAYPGLGFDRVLEDGQPSLALWLSLQAGYSRSRSWMGAEKTTHSPSINRWSGAWYLNTCVLDKAFLRNDSFPLNWHAFSEGLKNERALHVFQTQRIFFSLYLKSLYLNHHDTCRCFQERTPLLLLANIHHQVNQGSILSFRMHNSTFI